MHFSEKINFTEEEWFRDLEKYDGTGRRELGSVLRSPAVRTLRSSIT
jgi:hypothetical protein